MGFLEQIKLNYDLIIWDFDGTIVNLHIDWNAFKKDLAALCDKHNLTYEDTYYNYLMYTLAKNGYKNTSFKFVEQKESSAEYTIIEKAIDTIKNLSNKKQAVLSDNLKQTINKILNEQGINKYFNYLVGKQEVLKYKPDTEGAMKIFKHFSEINKDRILYIGDTWKDEDIAKSTGLDFLHINELINKI